MIIDLFGLVSNAQDLAQTNASYLSDNSIDLGAIGTVPQTNSSPKGDVGYGMPVTCHGQVTTAFTTSASGTLQMQVVIADNAALSSNLVVLAETAAIAGGNA